MRAILLLLFVLPTCFSLMAGCTAARWTWQSPIVSAPKSQSDKPETDKTTTDIATKEPSKADSKPVTNTAAADSPFKSSRSTEPKSAAPATQEKTAVAGATGNPGATTKPLEPLVAAEIAVTPPASGSLTPDVLLLINQELQDATPAERQEWYAQLKKVDPTLIPDILRVRRLSLQATTASQIANTETVSPFGTSPGTSPQRMQPPDTPAASPWSAPASAETIVPAGHQNHTADSTLLTAGYTRDAGHSEQIEHAVHRVDPTTPAANRPIVLQNHEYAANGMAVSELPPNPQRLPAPTAQPAAVPWPTPRVEATLPQSSGFGNVASGLVQNVVNLVPGRTPQVAAANLPATATGLSPASSPQLVNWQIALEQTIGLLEQDLAAMPPATTPEAKHELLKKHTSLRMLYLIGNHQERALTAIPGIEPAEQEFWQQLLWGTINALDAEHMPLAKDRATQTMTQLNSAIRRLQEQADLQVRHVTFCRQIVGFGNYEKLPKGEFSPGQEVLMYADIDNFKSDPTADGQYRTLLRSTIELMSPSGEVRKQIPFPATEDTCSTYRRDYFHNYQFRIPERMPLGPHVLKLTVFDELSGKMNSYSLNFIVK